MFSGLSTTAAAAAASRSLDSAVNVGPGASVEGVGGGAKYAAFGFLNTLFRTDELRVKKMPLS